MRMSLFIAFFSMISFGFSGCRTRTGDSDVKVIPGANVDENLFNAVVYVSPSSSEHTCVGI